MVAFNLLEIYQCYRSIFYCRFEHFRMFPLTMCTQLRLLRTGSYAPGLLRVSSQAEREPMANQFKLHPSACVLRWTLELCLYLNSISNNPPPRFFKRLSHARTDWNYYALVSYLSILPQMDATRPDDLWQIAVFNCTVQIRLMKLTLSNKCMDIKVERRFI